MEEDPFDLFRLNLMQRVLPIGIAIFERAKEGGVNNVFDAFQDSNDPFEDLRVEGEPIAEGLREKLDNVRPGLGNPVMQVQVDIDSINDIETFTNNDKESLLFCLSQIESRLNQLEKYFEMNTDDA